MGKKLERFGEVRIIDETNGFGLDFVEKTESRFWSTTLRPINSKSKYKEILFKFCLLKRIIARF